MNNLNLHFVYFIALLSIHFSAEKLVRRWAPLIWLAPDEQFLPGSVSDFLNHVTPKPRSPADAQQNFKVPMGPDSKSWFLVTKSEIGEHLPFIDKNNNTTLYKYYKI